MADWEHQRHKPPRRLPAECRLVVACPPMQSHVNVARILRAASCCGAQRMIVCGRPRLDSRIARDAVEQVQLEYRRSLPPALDRLRADGFQLVGLEQATGSVCLYDFCFAPHTALVFGHERLGLTADLLQRLDAVVEIPVYGLPFSYNVATAAAIALYEYDRQMARLDHVSPSRID